MGVGGPADRRGERPRIGGCGLTAPDGRYPAKGEPFGIRQWGPARLRLGLDGDPEKERETGDPDPHTHNPRGRRGPALGRYAEGWPGIGR